MKRYICQNLVLLLTIAFFTSCEEDIKVPSMTPYHTFKSVKTKTNVPEELAHSYSGNSNLVSSYLFTIGDCAYFKGISSKSVNGESTLGGVIHKYDSTNDEWSIVWYVTNNQINDLIKNGQQTVADRLQFMAQILAQSESTLACSYNNKGYISSNSSIPYENAQGMFEYDPSTNLLTLFSIENIANSFVKLFSTSKGIFGLEYEQRATYQFSLASKAWTYVGGNHQALTNLQSINNIIISNDKLYINHSTSSIGILSFPFNTYQEKNVNVPVDYGWDNREMYLYESYNYYGYTSNFILNQKMYIRSGENFYYEVDLTNYAVSLAFISNTANNNDYYYSSMYPIFTIGNKVYCYSEVNRSLIEITV